MKLELPDNNASVLFHMGNALQSIARDIDTSLPVNGHKVTHTETVGDVSRSVTVEPLMVMATGDKNPINTDESERRYLDESELSESIDNMTGAIAAEHEIPVNLLLGISDTIDADGLPWDQRIHSRGKTRLDDNTWRMARKPKDKSDEEWAEYVEGVKVELKALMAIPVAVTYDPNESDPFAIEPPVVIEAPEVVTPPAERTGPEHVDGDLFELDADTLAAMRGEVAKVDRPMDEAVEVVTPPVVIEAPEVVAPPVVDAVVAPPVVIEAPTVVTPPVVDAVVTPPVVDVVVTPPVVDVVVTGQTTFPELMKFITVNNKKLTKESVDEALKAQGLASIALLAARTDLIPQVHAALVKLL